jgi:filamentous hemagglutinin family protein
MLVLGTALSGSWVVAGQQPVGAVTLQPGQNLPGVTIGKNPFKSSETDVTLDNNAVIGWSNFDIGSKESVVFKDGRFNGKGTLAVLNRVNSSSPTNILGSLTSSPSVEVWIYNPSGIIVGKGAQISVGSLVLTTLNPDDNDFKAGASPSSYKLTDPGVVTKGIMVSDTASLSVSGGTRGLVLVSPVINATGSFNAIGQKPNPFASKAADQDVAFVTANAATLSYSAGSPLSVQIDKGTNMSAMNIVGGTVQGRNIFFAVASQTGINNVLLQVSADVTSAAQSGNGIVLTAGTAASNVSLAGGAATSGAVGLQTLVQSDNKLATSNSNVGILASGNGAVTLNEEMDSAGDVQVSATGQAAIIGTVTAQRNYSVSASGVELGGTQTAGGTLSVTSLNGAITGDAGLSLQSGANGGGGALTLQTTGATGGDIALAGDSTLLAAKNGNANADVQIGVAVASNNVTLGDVTARSLLGLVGAGSFGDTLATTGALTIGNVDTASSLNLSGGTLTTGALTSKNDISLQSTGSMQVAALDAGGDVTLNGGSGSVAVTGDVQAGGQYAITGGAVTLGTSAAPAHQQADGAVTINAGAGGIRGLGALTLESNADHSGAEALTLAITDVTSDAAINFDTSSKLLAGANRESDLIVRSGAAAGLVALGDVGARNLLGAVGAADPAQGLARTGELVFGNVTVTGPLNLSGAAITTGTLSSGGGVSLNAAGTLTVASIAAGGAVSLLGSGATAITGQLATSGDVAIDRGGALTLGSLQAGGNVALGGTTGLTTITVTGKASSGGSFTALSTGAQHWGDVSSGTALSLTDTGVTAGGITAGAITSGGSTAIASTGDLLATSIDSADGITLSGTGATTVNGAIQTHNASDGDLTIDRDGTIVLGGINPARNLAIGGTVAPASLTVNGNARVGGSILAATAGAQSWGGSVSAGGAISLAPTSGTLQVAGPITSSGAVTLASMDALTVGGKVQAGGAVAISGTTVKLGDVATSSGNIDVASTQGLNLGAVSAPGATTLTAGLGLKAASVKGGQGVALAAKGGGVDVDGAIDGGTGAVTATATGAVNLQHSVTAGGDYQVSGASVTLGGVQSAGGAVSVTATAGGITGLSGLALTANSAGTGTGGLALSATGGPVTLAGNSVLNGGSARQSDVSVSSDTGDIVLGNVDAHGLSVNGGKQLAGGFTAGNLSLATGLTLLAGAPGVHLGDVTIDAGDLSLGSLGALQVGDITTKGGTAQLTAASLDFGSITGAGATLTANGTAAGSGTITGGAIAATGPIQISALSGDGTVTLGPITATGANGSLVLNAIGQVLLDKVDVSGTADIATVTNPADVLFKDGLTAGGTIHVSSTRDVRADTISSIDGDLFISAPNGSVDSFTPGVGLDPSVSAGHTYSLNVGDNINLGVVTGGPISLTADSITAISIDAGSFDVTLNASSGDLSIARDVRGANIDLGATGSTTIGGNIIASGTVALSGGKGVSFHDISGASVAITSTGGISGRSITSSGAVGLNGTTLALNSIDAGGDVTGTTQDGDLAVSGDIDGGAVTLTSAGTVDVGGTITATGATALDGATGVTFAAINGPVVSVTSGGAITGQSVNTTGDANLTGASLTLASLSAEGSGTLAAKSGDLNVSGDIDGGTLTLSATGTTKLGGTVTASKAVALDGDGAVTFAAINGPAVSITSGSAIMGKSIGGTSDVTVRGATVALTSLDAGGGASLTTTDGDLTLGDATTGGNLLVDASGVATVSGDVSAGGNYHVRGASLALGGDGKTQQAGGAMLLTSTSGAIQAAAGTTLIANAGGATGDAMLIDSAGGIDFGGTTLDSKGGNLGVQAGTGQTVTLGMVKAGLIGGLATAADGTQSVSGTFTHDADFTAGAITAVGMSVSLTAGDMTLGDVTTSGALDLTTAQGAIATGAVHAGTLTVDAGGTLTGGDYMVNGGATVTAGSIALTSLGTTGGDVTVTTRTGELAIGTVSASGNAMLNGAAAVKLDQATAAALTINASGDVGGLSGAGAQLTANSGDLGVKAGGAVQLSGAKATTGAVTIAGNSVAIGGAITAGKALAIGAVTSLTMQDAQAGAGLTLQSGDALNAGTLAATGDATITGGKDVSITGLSTGGALTLTSAGNATLGSGSAGGVALIDAGGIATLGSLSAGPMLTVRASDADLTGTQSAVTVAFENRNGDTTAMNLGDDAGTGGFSLSAAEIGLVKADTLIFRQGAGDVQVGTLAFTADAGRKAVDVLGTGNMTITGTVSGSGSGRLFQFGGSDSSDSVTANAIWVRATPTAGGRLLFGDANLDLRGDRIAVGLGDGFVDDLQDASLDTVISSFVGNANSSLYNAALGGGGYDASAATLVSANSMTVHYGQYALFQNTGPARTSSGVVLGGTTGAPVRHALVLDTMPGDNAFALFGTLNGIGDTSASLLGGDVISLGNADLSNTRVNGCLAGSGSGCLAAVVIQPTLQVFQTSQEDVFGSAGDLSVPFDPLVGGTNEELLTGLAALAPRGPGDGDRRGGTTE